MLPLTPQSTLMTGSGLLPLIRGALPSFAPPKQTFPEAALLLFSPLAERWATRLPVGAHPAVPEAHSGLLCGRRRDRRKNQFTVPTQTEHLPVVSEGRSEQGRMA